VTAAALCVLVTTTVSIPIGAAPRERKVEVSPATNLGDQVVEVRWSGFRPTRQGGTYSVVLLQCKANPKSVLRDCNTGETFPYSLTGNLQEANTAKDGTGHVFMDIMTTSRLPALGCRETKSCSLLVYEVTDDGYDPNGLPPNRVIVPLLFAHSFGDCPPVRNFDVRVETEASAAPALYDWAAHFCTGEHAFTVDVTSSSSNAARENFLNRQIDIGVTSLEPTPDEITPGSPPYRVVPLDLTAVVIAYNIKDRQTNRPITDITLTPRLVARLVSDSDLTTFFHDPEFLKLNPGHKWPLQVAAPGVRGEKNADTWIVTNWLNGNPAARALLDGKDKYGIAVNSAWQNVSYPTDVFEARLPDGVYFPRAGEEGVAQRLFAETKPAESIPTDSLNAGFFGVLDLPTASRFRLPIAHLTNGVGRPVVALDPLTAQAGFRAMSKSPQGFYSAPAAVPGPQAWPLMKVDQAMVPPDLTNSNRDLRIRALLNYAVTEGQRDLPPGYAGLPATLQMQTLDYTGDTFLANPPTTTTTTTTQPFNASGYNSGSGYTGGYSDGSYTGTGSMGGETPGATPTSRPRTGRVTTTTPARAQLVGLTLPDSGDRLVLPVVLGLGLLALVVRLGEGARNRTRAWKVRR
jgi:hypothetical protein